MDIKDFDTFLTEKKIDAHAFKNADFAQWEKLKILYDQVSPNSFTAQKLFLINPIRRKFLLKEEAVKSEAVVQSRPKVVMRPKPKTN
uniref:hypothetical protein n=1 Tax=Roseivirga sp. TaxID=1964215 RepID=UPI0040474532